MGYLSIDNLYKYPNIFLFKEVYALEKIHGTSSHIQWDGWNLRVTYSAGGVKHEQFKSLFDESQLIAKFKELGFTKATIYGESYGGKMQAMSDVYGPSLKFVAFDVQLDGQWQNVPDAARIVKDMGLEFVSYETIKTDPESLDIARNKLSVQAARNGIAEPQQSEGVVLRPLVEMRDEFGGRIIAKYKTENFRETKTPRNLNPDQIEVLKEANAIASEWVTMMRLEHILGKSDVQWQAKHTGDIVKAMVADIKKESEGEIEWSKEAEKAIGKIASQFFQSWLKKNNA